MVWDMAENTFFARCGVIDIFNYSCNNEKEQGTSSPNDMSLEVKNMHVISDECVKCGSCAALARLVLSKKAKRSTLSLTLASIAVLANPYVRLVLSLLNNSTPDYKIKKETCICLLFYLNFAGQYDRIESLYDIVRKDVHIGGFGCRYGISPW